MNTKLIYDFCLNETIKGILEAIQEKDRGKMLYAILKKANLDALAGARFYDSKYVKHSKEYMGRLKDFLMNANEEISSIKLIKYLSELISDGAKIGSIQKLVNMTLKYIVVVNYMGYGDILAISIDLNKCDCPLDSNIISKLSKRTKTKYTPWTSVNSIEEYNSIQSDIRKYVTDSNLEFDFEEWGR